MGKGNRLWKDFLRDDEGNPSSMRLMSFLALLFAMFLSLDYVFDWGQDCKVDLELIVYFLLSAFVPKYFQKIAERRGRLNEGDAGTE